VADTAPTIRLSRTVMVANRRTFWKVRAMPSAATPCTGTVAMSLPASVTRPSVGS